MILAGDPSSLPRIEWEQFSGPLDLLLEEVRQQNVAIEMVELAPIVARFLGYLRTAAERSLNLDIEWLHMAATLIHWKSQSLLPSGGLAGSPADPIRDEIVQQLLAHRKQAAGELGRRRAEEAGRFSRTAQTAEGVEDSQEVEVVSVWDLIQQARELAGWVEAHRESRSQQSQVFAVEPDEVTVGERTEYLRTRMAIDEGAVDGTRLLEEHPSASHRACLFLAMLEMVRDGELEVEQDEPFGVMWLRRVRRTAARV